MKNKTRFEILLSNYAICQKNREANRACAEKEIIAFIDKNFSLGFSEKTLLSPVQHDFLFMFNLFEQYKKYDWTGNYEG